MAARSARPSGPPRWVWLVYLVLFGLSVPWYLPAGPLTLWFGLPHWVMLSLAAMVGVAGFTVAVVARYWPDADGIDPPAVEAEPRG